MKTLLTTLLFTAFNLYASAQSTFTEKMFNDMMGRYQKETMQFLKTETSPDCVFIGTGGFSMNYNQFLAFVEGGIFLTNEFTNVKIRQFGNTAIVTGLWSHSHRLKRDNSVVSYKELATETLVEQNGKWLLVSHHTSEATKVRVDEEAVIRRLEDMEREAFLKGDTTTLLTQLWSPEMVIHAPSNAVNTLDILVKRIAAGKLNYAQFDRKIEKITFNDNLAIVMGEEKLEPQGASDNVGKTLTRRFTNIWKYANGNWRVIARQSTVIKIE